MYYLPEPPYFMLVIGLLVSLTCGTAFSATLKESVQRWSNARLNSTIVKLSTEQLVVPFLGISAGVAIFLTAGLQIFGFPGWFAYVISIPLTLLTGLLVWLQLVSMLALVEKKGFPAIDIDSYQ